MGQKIPEDLPYVGSKSSEGLSQIMVWKASIVAGEIARFVLGCWKAFANYLISSLNSSGFSFRRISLEKIISKQTMK